MKYLKLFENWLNEASADSEVIKNFTSIFETNGFNVNMDNSVIKCKPQNISFDTLSSNISYNYEMEILDSKNPSNQNLKDGITLKTSINFPNTYSDGRWTLDPMDILNCKTTLNEAIAVKELIKSKFSEYLNKYGFMRLSEGGSSEVCFNGKWAKYYVSGIGDTWDSKDLKSKFTPEEIKIMKKHPNEGRRFLEELLKEVESVGQNLFKFELEKSSPLTPGYKLTSATSKDQSSVWDGGKTYNLSTASLAKGISEFKFHLANKYTKDASNFDISTRNPSDAGLNNNFYVAISYALGKAAMIETLYSKPTLTLALAGIYGNSENQYQPQVAANWNNISNNMQLALGVSPEEVQQFKPSEDMYSPSSTMTAPKKKP